MAPIEEELTLGNRALGTAGEWLLLGGKRGREVRSGDWLPSQPGGALSARGRFRDTRHWWLITSGFPDPGRQPCFLLPVPLGPSSTCAAAVRPLPPGRPVADIVAELLSRAGCTVADIPDLADEADPLHQLAHKGTHERRNGAHA